MGEGKWQKVNGDIAKVEYVPQISDAARMLLHDRYVSYAARGRIPLVQSYATGFLD